MTSMPKIAVGKISANVIRQTDICSAFMKWRPSHPELADNILYSYVVKLDF